MYHLRVFFDSWVRFIVQVINVGMELEATDREQDGLSIKKILSIIKVSYSICGQKSLLEKLIARGNSKNNVER